MIRSNYDISKLNYMALPALLPGQLKFYRIIDADCIIDYVANITGITLEQLRGKARYRHFVEARIIAIWLIRKHTTLSLQRIGTIFGSRDHTTVIYSCRAVNDLIETNEGFKQKLLLIENKLSA